MSQLYCGACRNYLMGSDGECHDCPCGWKQPTESIDESIDESSDIESLKAENESLNLRVAELESANKSAVRNWGRMVIERDRLQSENDLLERKFKIAMGNVPATVRTRLDMQMAEMRLKVGEE